MQEMITERQFNYLKGLIKSAGKEAYAQARHDLGIDRKFLERQLSKFQAQRLIGHLKEIVERHYDITLPSAGFEIETSYNTVMEVETKEVLLDWAKKRFVRDLPSLGKIEAFSGNREAHSLDVPGYKIKRR